MTDLEHYHHEANQIYSLMNRAWEDRDFKTFMEHYDWATRILKKGKLAKAEKVDMRKLADTINSFGAKFNQFNIESFELVKFLTAEQEAEANAEFERIRELSWRLSSAAGTAYETNIEQVLADYNKSMTTINNLPIHKDRIRALTTFGKEMIKKLNHKKQRIEREAKNFQAIKLKLEEIIIEGYHTAHSRTELREISSRIHSLTNDNPIGNNRGDIAWIDGKEIRWNEIYEYRMKLHKYH
jgi:hypothetical protein